MLAPVPDLVVGDERRSRWTGGSHCYWSEHCFRPSHPHPKPLRSAKAPEGPERSGGGAQRLAAARTPGLPCPVMVASRSELSSIHRPDRLEITFGEADPRPHQPSAILVIPLSKNWGPPLKGRPSCR